MKQPSIGNTEHFPPFNDTNDSQDVVEDASEIPPSGISIKLDEIDIIFIVALILAFLLIVAVVCRYVCIYKICTYNEK